MSQIDFEGTLILEKLAELDLVDKFYDLVDSDDIDAIEVLLRKVGIEDDLIEEVLNQIEEGPGL